LAACGICISIWALLTPSKAEARGERGAAPASPLQNKTDAAKKSHADRWDNHERSQLLDELTQGAEEEMAGVEPLPRLVSSSPRVYIFDDFFSDRECEYLINLSSGKLQPAGVVAHKDTKYDLQTLSRNNEQHWITNHEERDYPVLRHLIRRMHRVARIPDTDAEGLQIGRYTEGQKYEMHIDSAPAHDVTRPATLLMYLSDVEEGGDTLFPLSQRDQCHARWYGDEYGCAKCCKEDLSGTLKLHPKKGTAVLFFSHAPNGKLDDLTEHIACPVRAGTKWIAQRWFRTLPYQKVRQPVDRRFDGLPRETTRAEGPWNGRVHVLSQKSPRLYLLDSFLTDDECEHVASHARGGSVVIDKRFWQEDEVFGRIAHRMELAAYTSAEYAKAARVLGFSVDQSREVAPANSAGDWATLLIFLEEAQGGEAVFPVWRGSPTMPLASVCPGSNATMPSPDALRVPAKRGRAVLVLREMMPSTAPGKLESTAFGICPVTDGVLLMLEQSWAARRQQSSHSRMHHEEI